MISLENVCVSYGKQEVLHGISYNFSEGKNYCILGPNGCGKTTLIRAMAHLLPFEGKIKFKNTSVKKLTRLDLAGKIAVMSQINTMYFPYSVLETVLLGRYRQMHSRFFSRPDQQDIQKVERCIQEVGLWEYRDKNIEELSGGQRQRVFLAQILAQDPDIILLDEPTNHLDIHYQLELVDLLKKWSSDSTHMVIGVFHDINLALRLTDQVLFMQDGKLVKAGSFSQTVDLDFLSNLYQIDMKCYITESFKNWRRIDGNISKPV